jgi:monomeric isocitrate dehydrogenase
VRCVHNVCREPGQFNWQTTGHVSNVGLMAQKAEEYEMCTYPNVCREHGQFNWQTTGHVSNVGLMAQKTEEYEMCTVHTLCVQGARAVQLADNWPCVQCGAHGPEGGEV